MWIQARMYLLVALMFAIVYGIIVAFSSYMGVASFLVYGILAAFMMLIQRHFTQIIVAFFHAQAFIDSLCRMIILFNI